MVEFHFLFFMVSKSFDIINYANLLISLSGASTKPPMLMMAIYWITGNQAAMNKMNGGGGPPGMMM